MDLTVRVHPNANLEQLSTLQLRTLILLIDRPSIMFNLPKKLQSLIITLNDSCKDFKLIDSFVCPILQSFTYRGKLQIDLSLIKCGTINIINMNITSDIKFDQSVQFIVYENCRIGANNVTGPNTISVDFDGCVFVDHNDQTSVGSIAFPTTLNRLNISSYCSINISTVPKKLQKLILSGCKHVIFDLETSGPTLIQLTDLTINNIEHFQLRKPFPDTLISLHISNVFGLERYPITCQQLQYLILYNTDVNVNAVPKCKELNLILMPKPEQIDLHEKVYWNGFVL